VRGRTRLPSPLPSPNRTAVQKPGRTEAPDNAQPLQDGDIASLIEEAVNELTVEESKNASYVYARVLRKAMQKHLLLDHLHLGDVLVALRKAGYVIDRKTGLLRHDPPISEAA
jgi:hypothetical protein